MLAALAGTELQAQTLQSAPRLVVNITIDQLRTDYIEHFSPLYGEEGFRKLLQNGCVYEAANYPFSPVDRASAIATIATGATPHYNNIVGTKWLDRNTLRPVFCTDDETYNVSPQKIATTTVSDELKIFTKGAALVYSTAMEKDAAVISAGHAADGAFWLNEKTGQWTTSTFTLKARRDSCVHTTASRRSVPTATTTLLPTFRWLASTTCSSDATILPTCCLSPCQQNAPMSPTGRQKWR